MHLAQADDRLISETLFALCLVLQVEPAARDQIMLALLKVNLAVSDVGRRVIAHRLAAYHALNHR